MDTVAVLGHWWSWNDGDDGEVELDFSSSLFQESHVILVGYQVYKQP